MLQRVNMIQVESLMAGYSCVMMKACQDGVYYWTLSLQVPCAATVYCQPIQMRCSNALGYNVEQTNQWRWRPDYEGLDLASNK